MKRGEDRARMLRRQIPGWFQAGCFFAGIGAESSLFNIVRPGKKGGMNISRRPVVFPRGAPTKNSALNAHTCFRQRRCRFLLSVALLLLSCLPCAAITDVIDGGLQIPMTGSNLLRVLTPNVLELILINTKQPDPARVDSWDWVNDQGNFAPPDTSSIQRDRQWRDERRHRSGVQTPSRFMRRWRRGILRIANHLYLQLSSPISDGQSCRW